MGRELGNANVGYVRLLHWNRVTGVLAMLLAISDYNYGERQRDKGAGSGLKGCERT